MSQDMRLLLEDWSFDPKSNVREIEGDDGQSKLQVRIDQGAFQGILQLNLDGRPDGRRPHSFDFSLDYYRHLQNGDAAFTLDKESCGELFDESARIYSRYAFLLELRDYTRVIRDTQRNMDLFRFVNTHAESEEDRNNLEKWWPYVLRIHATAKAMQICEEETNYDQAVEVVNQARQQIAELAEVEAEEFFAERDRSDKALQELGQKLLEDRPLSEEERLERELQAAIDIENFERAAELRDQLRDRRDATSAE